MSGQTEYCKCGRRANQRLIMKTVLIVDHGRSPGFVAGDTWNSAAGIFLCNKCSSELFKQIEEKEN